MGASCICRINNFYNMRLVSWASNSMASAISDGSQFCCFIYQRFVNAAVDSTAVDFVSSQFLLSTSSLECMIVRIDSSAV